MNAKNENYTPKDRIDRTLRDRLMAEENRYRDEVRQPVPPMSRPRPASRQASARVYDHCGCEKAQPYENSNRLTGVSLAMVYSPYQEFTDLYSPEEGFEHGTIFMQLHKPFSCASSVFRNSVCRDKGEKAR